MSADTGSTATSSANARRPAYERLRDRLVVNDSPRKLDYWADRDRSKSRWGEWTFEIVEMDSLPQPIGNPSEYQVRCVRTKGKAAGYRMPNINTTSLTEARRRLNNLIGVLCSWIREGVPRRDVVLEHDFKGDEDPSIPFDHTKDPYDLRG